MLLSMMVLGLFWPQPRLNQKDYSEQLLMFAMLCNAIPCTQICARSLKGNFNSVFFQPPKVLAQANSYTISCLLEC